MPRPNPVADEVRRGPRSPERQPPQLPLEGVPGPVRPLLAERRPSANPGSPHELTRLRVLEPHLAAAYLPPKNAIRRPRMIPDLLQLRRTRASIRRLASIRGSAPPARLRPAACSLSAPPPKPAGGGG